MNACGVGTRGQRTGAHGRDPQSLGETLGGRGSHIITPIVSECYFDDSWRGGVDEREVGASEAAWEIVGVGTREGAIGTKREGDAQNRVRGSTSRVSYLDSQWGKQPWKKQRDIGPR